VVVMEDGTKEVEGGAQLCRSGRTGTGCDFKALCGSPRNLSRNFAGFETAGRGTEGVAHAMQIISGIYAPDVARNSRNGGDGQPAGEIVRTNFNEALAQFRANSKAAAALEEADRQVPAGAVR